MRMSGAEAGIELYVLTNVTPFAINDTATVTGAVGRA